jgi:seryl-tRNA synthetase
MLDPQLLRADPESIAAMLAPRGYTLDVAAWRELETRRKGLQVRVQELQNRKNVSAKSVGQAKSRGEDIQPLLDEIKHLGEELGQVEAELGRTDGVRFRAPRSR